MKKLICFVLLLGIVPAMLAACTSPREQPGGQLEQPQPQQVTDRPTDATFESTYTELALDLFQHSAKASQEENLLISPLSIQLALAMTANGADGKTRQEMEAVLGGDIPLDELNAYLHTYTKNLPSGEKYKLSLANSIWLRDKADRLTVEERFLQTNANYYDAEIYKRAFDDATVKEINNWVDRNTDGMIDKLLERIDSSAMMYLINTIVFDAEWEEPYTEDAIYEGSFIDIVGQEQTVTMMHSSESQYLSDGKATGFIKPYSGDKYSFAVMLPNEDVSLYDYIDSLTVEGLVGTLSNAEECTVITQLPKFSYEYELTMNDVLAEMGMPTAFDWSNADFTKLGHSTDGNLYIGKVLHKTFIQVDGMGTEAGAVTMVQMNYGCAMGPESEVKEVIVDRPFVYMILDSETNLPLFIGCVTGIPE